MSAHHPHGFEVRQEEDDVPGPRLAWIGVLVVVVSVVAVVLAALLLGKDQARLGGGPAGRVRTEGSVAPPTIGIIEQTLIEHEARGVDQRSGEERRLHEYGWVDRPHGVAHIPIDRAMDLVVIDNARAGDGGAR